MDKYRVLTLSIIGRSSRILRFGEIVSPNHFEKSHLDKLLKDGAIELVEKKEVVEELNPITLTNNEVGVDVTVTGTSNNSGKPTDQGIEYPSYDDMTKKEVVEELNKREFDFNQNNSKQVLYDLLTKG